MTTFFFLYDARARFLRAQEESAAVVQTNRQMDANKYMRLRAREEEGPPHDLQYMRGIFTLASGGPGFSEPLMDSSGPHDAGKGGGGALTPTPFVKGLLFFCL